MARLPLLSAPEFAAQFAQRNALGMTLDEARRCARLELDTGASPHTGVSFGLSSGTTGEPGVFLTTEAERARWIGTLLARYFPLRQLTRRSGLDIALLLKHNSRLYTDAERTGKLRLHHFDLRQPLAQWIDRLAGLAPEVLIAPPGSLIEIARSHAAVARCLRPEMLLAAAEPLFPQEHRVLEAAYGVAPRGIYQAREGFLAWGCEHGRLHLNEDLIAFEFQRFATHADRLVPVITDFTRTSQRYWRTRLDDVLLADANPCPCGSAFLSIRAVEGRLQDVLLSGGGAPLFPFEIDAVLQRHLPAQGGSALVQHDRRDFTLCADRPVSAALREELSCLLAGPAGTPPRIAVGPFAAPLPGEKRRRFQRLFDPDSNGLIEQLGPPVLMSARESILSMKASAGR